MDGGRAPGLDEAQALGRAGRGEPAPALLGADGADVGEQVAAGALFLVGGERRLPVVTVLRGQGADGAQPAGGPRCGDRDGIGRHGRLRSGCRTGVPGQDAGAHPSP
ncbi:hypothetical protein EAO77_34010 [Streptomyces sp. t39]|nr:hypothetical protein EAO77_34010 [Streptomyces sp. t39]